MQPNTPSQAHAVPDFDTDIKSKSDVAKLLQEIKGIMHQFDTHINIYEAIDEAHRRFSNYRQQPDESNATYLKKFKNNLEVLEHYGGSIRNATGAIKCEKLRDSKSALVTSTPTDKEYMERCYHRRIGVMFLRRADRQRYNELLQDLRNSYTMERDEYPNNLEHAFEMVQNFQPSPSPTTRNQRQRESGSQQLQHDHQQHHQEEEPLEEELQHDESEQVNDVALTYK